MRDSKMFLYYLLILFCIHVGIDCSAFEKVRYNLGKDPVDVVIPSLEKDLPTLELCIEGIRKHGENVRRIIVVSDKKLTDKAEWFDEAQFPFSKSDIALAIFHGDHEKAQEFMRSPCTRVGWIFAQCVKLYAAVVIPGISSNVLIIDSDTVFLNLVSFIGKSGGGLYNPGTECHMPYFHHMNRLLPGLRRIFPQYSGISHHILIQRPILEDLFARIKVHHNREAWRAICACIDLKELYGSACADYEIYFAFAFDRTDQVQLRFLKWANSGCISDRHRYQSNGYHFASFHTYMR
jgi:hypothetical protein